MTKRYIPKHRMIPNGKEFVQMVKEEQDQWIKFVLSNSEIYEKAQMLHDSFMEFREKHCGS